MISYFDEQYNRKRRNKKSLMPNAQQNLDRDQSCLRTLGLQKPKRIRKVIKLTQSKASQWPLWMMQRKPLQLQGVPVPDESSKDITAKTLIDATQEIGEAAAQETITNLQQCCHPLFHRPGLSARRRALARIHPIPHS